MEAVGKTVMSVPVSAMMSWAPVGPMPCTASSCSTWCRKGAISASIRSVSASIWVV